MLNAIRNGWAKTRAAVSSTLFPTSSGDSRNDGSSPPAPLSFPQPGGLRLARASFQACLDDLRGDSVAQLRSNVQYCRSIQDLWHLRAWLYTEVARAHSQSEAERRLQMLGVYFATLTPATGKRH